MISPANITVITIVWAIWTVAVGIDAFYTIKLLFARRPKGMLISDGASMEMDEVERLDHPTHPIELRFYKEGSDTIGFKLRLNDEMAGALMVGLINAGPEFQTNADQKCRCPECGSCPDLRPTVPFEGMPPILGPLPDYIKLPPPIYGCSQPAPITEDHGQQEST